jgi:zinc-ribbon domain
MAASFCPKCGAALPPGAQFCAFCGSPAPNLGGAGTAPAPLPSAGPTPPPYPPYPTMEPNRPSPSRRRRGLVIAIVVVVLIAIIGGLAFYELTAPIVDVNEFLVWAPDNVCGLNEPNNLIAYQGFNDSPGVTDYFQFEVPNYNTSECNLVSVSTNTSGFTVSDATVPLSIASQGTGTLSLNLTLPGSAWSGNVNLVFG